MDLKNIFKDYVNNFNKLKSMKPQLYNMNDHQIFYIDLDHLISLVTLDIETLDIELGKKITSNPSEYFPCTNFTVIIPHDNFLGVCHVFRDTLDKSGFQYQPSYETGKFYSSINNDNWDTFQELFIYSLLYSLNTKDTYIGNTTATMRTPSGRTDAKSISIIATKKCVSKYTNDFKSTIEWKHSWECMGHWRICKAVGKDREGTYNQIGRTWVKPCIKGNGELIKKIRIVK